MLVGGRGGDEDDGVAFRGIGLDSSRGGPRLQELKLSLLRNKCWCRM